MTVAYRNRLVVAYPCIHEIWLFGSRANNRNKPESDWDYLVQADDARLLNVLYLDKQFDEPGIDLFVLDSGLRIAMNPWSVDRVSKVLKLDAEVGNLHWVQKSQDATEASYIEVERIPRSFNVSMRRARAELVRNSRDVGPRFHSMSVQHFTSCRPPISRDVGPPFHGMSVQLMR